MKRSRYSPDFDDSQMLYEKEVAAKIKKKMFKSASTSSPTKQCMECILYEHKHDRRNEYFSQLLNEELDNLLPCMRTSTYVKILNFIRSMKNVHSNE